MRRAWLWLSYVLAAAGMRNTSLFALALYRRSVLLLDNTEHVPRWLRRWLTRRWAPPFPWGAVLYALANHEVEDEE